MGKIRVLEESVINRIAAGEVVERPASVVKELVENSLDAGAKKVTVELAAGGRGRVRVADNGQGMDQDDALLSLERHATSKIVSERDLVAVETMGFRGEALSSIAAVSKVTIVTRRPELSEGTLVRAVGGKVVEVSPAGSPPGTTVTVDSLFFNTPARKQFLKSPKVELAHSHLKLLKIAVARPDVSFELTHDGRRLLAARGGQPLAERLALVFGRSRGQEFIPIEHDADGIRVTGLIMPPHATRADSRHLFFYVNNRQIKDPLIHRAVLEGYATRVPRGRYPLAAIFVYLPPEMLDVNVHPAKQRVRFRTTGDVFAAVLTAVARGLAGLDMSRWSPRGAIEAREQPAAPLAGPGIMEPRAAVPEQPRMEFVSGAEAEPGFFSSLNPLGQVAASYIVADTGSSLVIIDQHAAHERIIYEELGFTDAVPSQSLAEPVVLDLDPGEAEALERVEPALKTLGFDLSPFGERSVIMRAHPQAVDAREAADFIQASLERALETGARPREEELFSEFRSDLACRAALKAGKRLSQDEMRALLRRLDRLNVASSCPHGRPLWREITSGELAALFGRKERGPSG